jgi:hypothetical protein
MPKPATQSESIVNVGLSSAVERAMPAAAMNRGNAAWNRRSTTRSERRLRPRRLCAQAHDFNLDRSASATFQSLLALPLQAVGQQNAALTDAEPPLQIEEVCALYGKAQALDNSSWTSASANRQTLVGAEDFRSKVCARRMCDSARAPRQAPKGRGRLREPP